MRRPLGPGQALRAFRDDKILAHSWKPYSLQPRQRRKPAQDQLDREVRRALGVDWAAFQHLVADLAGHRDAGGGQVAEVDRRGVLALQNPGEGLVDLVEHRDHLGRSSRLLSCSVATILK